MYALKMVTTVFCTFMLISTSAQKDAIRENLIAGPQLTIQEASVMHGADMEPSFNMALTGDAGKIEKEWRKFLSSKYKFKLDMERDFGQAVNVQMPDVDDQPVSMYCRVDKDGKQAVLVVMLKSGGSYISGAESQAKSANLKRVMTDFGNEIYNAQYEEYVNDETKALDKARRELAGLTKDVEKLGKEIGKTENDISKSEAEIKKTNGENQNLESRISKMKADKEKANLELTKLTEESTMAVDPKKSEKLAKKIEKVQNNIIKANEGTEKANLTIEKNKENLQKLEQSIQENRDDLEKLKKDLSKAEKDEREMEKDFLQQEDKLNQLKNKSIQYKGG